MEKVNHNQQQVMYLRCLGFTYKQIARVLGLEIGTVRSRLHYGRKKYGKE